MYKDAAGNKRISIREERFVLCIKERFSILIRLMICFHNNLIGMPW